MTQTEVAGTRKVPASLRHWPALVGLAFAAVNAVGMSSGLESAAVLAASAFVYIGAAAVGLQRSAWPLFLASVVLITLVRVFDPPFDAAWVVLGGGLVLGLYGLVRGAIRPGYALPLQSLAYLAFGGATVLALFVNPTVGAYLVAVGLLGHAAWDVWHHRTNRVVSRSLAEFCLFLDTALALAIIYVTATSGG